METSGLFFLLVLILVLAVYVIIIRWVAERLIKSKLSDDEKIYWTISFVVFNMLAGLIFVIYHDYFLNSSKRSV
jgi:hypothetical protein